MQKLNRNALKYIAIFAMISDHIAMIFLPKESAFYFAMRLIGRFTAPIMCFFIAEGFRYTSSKYKYGFRLGVFALISQLPYTLMISGGIFTINTLTNWNVIYTFFISFIILLAYEKIQNKPLKLITILLLAGLTIVGDWGIIAPLWVLIFHTYKDEKKKQFIVYGIVVLLQLAFSMPLLIKYNELWQIGMFGAIPLLMLYNGSKGSKKSFHKWAFYLFYPLHMLVLWVLISMPQWIF